MQSFCLADIKAGHNISLHPCQNSRPKTNLILKLKLTWGCAFWHQDIKTINLRSVMLNHLTV